MRERRAIYRGEIPPRWGLEPPDFSVSMFDLWGEDPYQEDCRVWRERKQLLDPEPRR